VDFRLFEALNGTMRGHPTVDHAVAEFSSWSVPVFAAATILLWFLARPGGSVKWKAATVAALASAGVALLVNQVIGHVWFRERPFVAHPAHAVVLTARSTDPSFPSDHAAAAFAIATAVFAFSARAGLAFFAGAVLISLSRIFVGLHYPGDVLGGALIGIASALLVVKLAEPLVVRVAELAGRVTDPAVDAATTRFGRARRSRPG
jgi:undecaprenyl-diphosphatase